MISSAFGWDDRFILFFDQLDNRKNKTQTETQQKKNKNKKRKIPFITYFLYSTGKRSKQWNKEKR